MQYPYPPLDSYTVGVSSTIQLLNYYCSSLVLRFHYHQSILFYMYVFFVSVNVDPKTQEREQSSFTSRFKLFHGTKKKHHSTSSSDMRKQALEKKLSNPNTAKDYDLPASAIKMSEEDRMALMIMVKQGELTVEEAVERLKR